MENKQTKLFELLREKQLETDSNYSILKKIREDKELVKVANSYCVQCGHCCNSQCQNIEKREDGLTYCLLHDNSGNPYPNGKKIPEYSKDIYSKLNSEKWIKPLVCHTYGPQVSVLALIAYKKQGKKDLFEKTQKFCIGASKMFKEYEEFFKNNQ